MRFRGVIARRIGYELYLFGCEERTGSGLGLRVLKVFVRVGGDVSLLDSLGAEGVEEAVHVVNIAWREGARRMGAAVLAEICVEG